MKITIGLTRTDRAANYVPAMDGYRPGAPQDVVVLEVEAGLEQPPEHGWQTLEVGEAYFKATSAPFEVVAADPLAHAVYEALLAWTNEAVVTTGLNHRLEMLVGDTVQLDGGPVLACAPFGWEEVAI